MLVDSHSHLHFPVYREDIAAVMGRMKEKNVSTLTVGTSYTNSLEAVEFSKKHGIPCSVGFHPSHARPKGAAGYLDPTEEVYDEEFDSVRLKALLTKERVVVKAIGECGLDYFRLPEDEGLKKLFKQKQREAFEAQIALAKEFDLPLIIHTRASKEDPSDAYKDTFEIVSSFKFQVSRPGVMHCFLGSKDWAKKFLDLGFYLSFSGIVTFKKADETRESAKIPPSDMILIETDCPYLAPEPHRGQMNEPSYVEFVLRKLEEVRGERLEERVEENFKKLFGL